MSGVPYLQPWPCGSQIGVADLAGDGTVALSTIDVAEGERWDGPGAALHAALEQQIVGSNPSPLRSAPGNDTSLIQAMIEGVLSADSTVDIAALAPRDVWNQAPRDGTVAFLPQGAISMADVLRLAPCSGGRSAWGGQLVVAEVTPSDADRMVDVLAPGRDAPDGDPAVIARRSGQRDRVRIALPPYHAARIEQALDRAFEWSVCPTTWRDALLSLPWIDRDAASTQGEQA